MENAAFVWILSRLLLLPAGVILGLWAFFLLRKRRRPDARRWGVVAGALVAVSFLGTFWADRHQTRLRMGWATGVEFTPKTLFSHDSERAFLLGDGFSLRFYRVPVAVRPMLTNVVELAAKGLPRLAPGSSEEWRSVPWRMGPVTNAPAMAEMFVKDWPKTGPGAEAGEWAQAAWRSPVCLHGWRARHPSGWTDPKSVDFYLIDAAGEHLLEISVDF